MLKLSKIIFYILISVFIFVSGTIADPLSVFVSIVPQQYIVQQIGKDLVAVQVMVEPGASPHTYEPKPAQMAALSRTRLYFSVGVEFEKVWLPRFSAVNPHMRTVAMDHGIEKLPMTDHDHADNDEHRDAHAHAHEHLLDPHIWLSPPLVKIMAKNTLEALAALEPDHAPAFRQNFEAFAMRLDEVHARITRIMAGRQGERFMAFHPSWGYFAHTYGLVQVAIEADGKEPKPAQLQRIIQEARALKIKVVFAQPQLSSRSARIIAEAIEGEVFLADPLAYQWDTNLLEQAEAFQKALR